MPTKSSLRVEIQSQLAQLSDKKIQTHSETIFFQLQKYISKFSTRSIFLSLPNEVQTQQLIEQLRREEKTVLIPYIDENDTMQMCIYTPKIELKAGLGGVLEPVDPQKYTKKIDVTITPGLAFTRNNHRLGRGKGYYDKFFAKYLETYKIGICFPEQIVKKIPVEYHDVRMDLVISTY